MARNGSKIKLGYYPLPPAEGTRLRNLLDFEPGASAVDPCAGTGAALHQLTEGAEVEKHGVELDAGRAAQSAASGITTVHGNLFDTIGKSESFSFLYLNPPYDSEIGAADNKRMEYLFLEHTFRWLIEGGVLLMVVPQERLDSAIPLLAGNFSDLRIFRLTDPEAERFDQVALFGVRKRMRGEHYDRNRALLVDMEWRYPMPVLTGAETAYRVPSSTPAPLVYRGLPLDQVEDVVLTSSTWKQVAPFLLPREEVQNGRPITPLHAGHVGLLCTAGLLNGVFGQGSDRHIGRWRTVKSVSVFEVKENGFKEIHKRERFTNELALIYEDGRTLVLARRTRKRIAMQNAHLRLGRLQYTRNTEKTNTQISVHVDHYIGNGEQSHLLSVFGGDAEVGAIRAAIYEKHTFTLTFPDGAIRTVGFGPDAVCYNCSLALEGRKRTLRHLVSVSAALQANGNAGTTYLMHLNGETKELAWAIVVSLLGVPADPRWGETILGGMRRDKLVRRLDGIGCDPAIILGTRQDVMDRIGEALKGGLLALPEKNGPILWPRFDIRESLASASRPAMHYAQSA
jgi:hypothetical protein